MATKKTSARRKPIAAVDDLPDEPVDVLREELQLIREEIADQGRRVAFSVALLGGAGVLGLGAFGVLTTAAVAALGRNEDTARGALLMAAIYAVGAGALGGAGARRLGRVTPEAGEAIQHEVKEAAKSVRRAT